MSQVWRMYSRYRAFVFLTGLIFAVISFSFLIQGLLHKENISHSLSAAPAENVTPLSINPTESWRDDLGVPVLCYHQIVTEEKYRERPTPYAVTVEQFREQMRWLKKNNFYSILPDELLAYVKAEKRFDFKKGRPIVLTFDDGNNDFVDHAEEILNEMNFKAVLFIYPTYILAKKPRALTWAQIREARENGHAIESHTMWHPMLNTMNATDQRAQFRDSKRLLDKNGGARVRHLAYPFGIYSEKSAELLKDEKYVSAYTTFPGGNQIGEDPFHLRRYLIVKQDSMKQFAQKTLLRSLPARLLNHREGEQVDRKTQLKFSVPKNLGGKFEIKIFSRKFEPVYDAKNGELIVDITAAKKRLSVVEILYKEDKIKYQANVLLNHKPQES